MTYLFLTTLGLAIGGFGTIAGIGGGFILMPALLLLHPERNPIEITSLSLLIIFLSSTSGTLAYIRHGNINFKLGLYFALATIPGAILGALITSHLNRQLFDPITATLLIGMGITILFSRNAYTSPQKASHLHTKLGIACSFLIGFIATLLGIGGGILQVPMLVHFLRFSVRAATATSTFIVAIAALSGSFVHLLNGYHPDDMIEVLALATGVIIGARIGAHFSKRIDGQKVMRALALVIILAGARIGFHLFN